MGGREPASGSLANGAGLGERARSRGLAGAGRPWVCHRTHARTFGRASVAPSGGAPSGGGLGGNGRAPTGGFWRLEFGLGGFPGAEQGGGLGLGHPTHAHCWACACVTPSGPRVSFAGTATGGRESFRLCIFLRSSTGQTTVSTAKSTIGCTCNALSAHC